MKTPLYPDRTVTFVEDLSIESESKDGSVILYKPRLSPDDKGSLWIRTNEEKIEGDKILTAFDIFDSNGLYYARIWTEFYSFIFKKGNMYRMETDQDTGYKTLKRYKVVRE